ncbi:MAG TPA: HSP90 family protein [Microterricola sp.]
MSDETPDVQRFQVDLSGMVDLLSRHLYSGPQVYVRELLQNGVDAITARRKLDPEAPARITITVADGLVEVHDTGAGLTDAEARELLATIGRSSKRDPLLGLGRTEYIGQFGIGMLAAFMIASRIEVTSRSMGGAAPIRWVGHDDGTFEVAEIADADAPESGTRVRLVARPDMAEWVSLETVSALAREYGSFLPFPVVIEAPGHAPESVSRPELPWKVQYASDAARAAALRAYCEQELGFTPLAHIDLEVPLAGVSGVAFVLPQSVTAGSHAHRVYVKRILLNARTEGLLPEWAFFVRVVADTALSPTASREALHDDEILEATREQLGAQLRAWARRTLTNGSDTARAFISTHHLALRSLAVSDAEMLELVAQILPYETTDGLLTLAEVSRQGELLYTTTTEAYRRVATVARAQGLIVVNAGYVYDAEIIQKLGLSGWVVRELGSGDLVQVLGELEPSRTAEVAEATVAARLVLASEDCDVIVREFEPRGVPSILLRDREGDFQRGLRSEREQHGGAWGDLLGSLTEPEAVPTRTLVLNDSAPVARQLLDATGDVFDAGLKSLYLSAVMLAGEGLRPSEIDAMNNALSVLLSASLRGTAQ